MYTNLLKAARSLPCVHGLYFRTDITAVLQYNLDVFNSISNAYRLPNLRNIISNKINETCFQVSLSLITEKIYMYI